MNNYSQKFNAVRYLIKTNEVKFKEIFGVSLKSFYGSALEMAMFGFDLIKFDKEFLKTPDGKSVNDYVKEKYGIEGYNLINILTTEYSARDIGIMSALL